MKILKKQIGRISLSVVLAIISVALGTVPYFATADIVNKIIAENRSIEAYIFTIIVMIVGFIGSIVFNLLSTITSHHLAYEVIENLRKSIVEKLSSISMGDVEKKSSGEWAQFIVETLDKMEKPIAHVIPEVLSNILVPVVLISIIFTVDWRVGMANLATIPLGIVFTMLMMRDYENKSKRYMEASKTMNTAMVEYVQGIKVIKAFDKTASSYQKFKDSVQANKDAMLNWYLSTAFPMTAGMEILPATMVFVLPTIMFLYMKGGILPSDAILCILVSFATYKPLIKAMSHTETMANIRVVAEEIKKIMEVEDLERGNKGEQIYNFDVKFKDILFSYNEETIVLKEFSFVANENSLTAIVGPSGSGKSTVAKLIAGFWNPDKGEILIGGKELRNMPLEQNMKLVTYVSQESHLLNKSILENLKIGKADASNEEVEIACKKAGIHEFIKGLPNGYHTQVGESGSKVSGGEKQRIALARAFLKDAPIVLLDEASAYADPDNEAIIQEAINNLVKDKTVIMIAHRLSTIVRADKIIVLNEGKIIEEGNHQGLLEKDSVYKKMWDSYVSAQEMEVISNDKVD